jgi:hypothetical protein
MKSNIFKLCVFIALVSPLSIWGQYIYQSGYTYYPLTHEENAHIDSIRIGQSSPAYGIDIRVRPNPYQYGMYATPNWSRQFLTRRVNGNLVGKGYFGVYGTETTANYAYIGLQSNVASTGLNLNDDGTPYIPNEYNYANNIKFYPNGNMAIPNSLGIGTTTPQAKLDVVGAGKFAVSSGANLVLQKPSGAAMSFTDGTNENGLIQAGASGINHLQFYTNTASNTGIIERVRITNLGNVGIGTTTPQAKLDVKGNIWTDGIVNIGTTAPPAGYKLAIEGNAIAEKVVVKLKTAWPDYVFKPDYTLPSLSTVEQHIKEKGHLPNIPSEKEVQEIGIDLGSMDAKLLQKIEELTLYLIKQEKQLTAQQKEIDALKAQMKR